MGAQTVLRWEAPPPEPRQVRLDTAALYAAVDQRLREHGISGREMLRQIGERTPSTLTRLAQGTQPSADLLVRILHWLRETDLAPYIVPVTAEEASQDA